MNSGFAFADHLSGKNESATYEKYAREIIQATGVTPKLLEKELQIDEKELERLGRD